MACGEFSIKISLHHHHRHRHRHCQHHPHYRPSRKASTPLHGVKERTPQLSPPCSLLPFHSSHSQVLCTNLGSPRRDPLWVALTSQLLGLWEQNRGQPACQDCPQRTSSGLPQMLHVSLCVHFTPLALKLPPLWPEEFGLKWSLNCPHTANVWSLCRIYKMQNTQEVKQWSVLPWLVWLSGLSTSLRTKGSQVRFPVRTHAWLQTRFPVGGT